ncbi:MAG: Na/Pi symporter [Tuberibacillus sp.]
MSGLITTFIIYFTIFFFGMTVMRIGLLNASEDRIKTYLFKATDKPVKGLIFGMISTALIQSSSAITVIAIGLVSSGLITFRQTIGVILGTNIGTTITGEIASFNIGSYFWVFLIVGVTLLFIPYQKAFVGGTFCFGLGCLFVAMNGFNSLSKPLESLAPMKSVLSTVNASLLIAVAVGAVFTAVIQSSSATQLIVMGLVNADVITLTAACGAVLGANIGTCATALLASIGAGKPARFTAYTHAIFNVFGVLLFFPFMPAVTEWLSSWAGNADAAVAHFSVLFNVITALLALPLANPYGRWVDRYL